MQAGVSGLGDSATGSVSTGEAAAPEQLVATALEKWGRLDGALLCVGASPLGRVSDVTDEQWSAAFETVFLGALRLSRHIAQNLPSSLTTGHATLSEPAIHSDYEPATATDMIPLRRHGEHEEFGRVATYLLSPAASYITGAMIPIDGGILRSL